MTKARKLKPATKAVAYRWFEKRYEPIPDPLNPDIVYREFDDPEWERLKTVKDGFRYVWTIVDCDGKLYLLPGYHFVNRINWVLTKNPWPDEENQRGGYTW